MVRHLLQLIALGIALPGFAAADPLDDMIAQDEATGGGFQMKIAGKMAREGNGAMQMLVAEYLLRGDLKIRNVEEAIVWMKRAVDNGKAKEASFQLGRLYDQYGPLGFYPEEAARWYERSFEAGNSCAALERARLYDTVRYKLKQDYDKSEQANWYEKCAEKGLRLCQGIVGEDALGKDYAKAFHWLVRSVEEPRHDGYKSSLGYSQAAIGMMCEHGLGTTKNLKEAVHWYSLAIENESEDASWALAELLRKGEVGLPNPSRAAELYEEAAKRGHQPSQYRLGLAFLRGDGVRHDPVQAVKWLRLATEPSAYVPVDLDLLQRDPAMFAFRGLLLPNDWADSVAELAILERTLDQEQFEEGQKLAREFERIVPFPPFCGPHGCPSCW